MALFKPFKGSRSSLDAQPIHDGYAYFCTDDGSFHIDYEDSNGVLHRKQINAQYADAIVGCEITPEKIAAWNSAIPKLTSVAMLASGWNKDGNIWSQEVACNGVTANSKLDLQPTPVQIVTLQDSEVSLMATNDNGTVVIYAIGNVPTSDMNMQILITEVAVV